MKLVMVSRDPGVLAQVAAVVAEADKAACRGQSRRQKTM
jgi:hypothetical protein